MNRTVLLQASSRSLGDTHQVVNFISQRYPSDIIDLKTKKIGAYDYEYKNSKDDFLPTITEIIENYDTILFATPVYWYTMSGILKTFLDRISDLLRIHKNLGRQLRGKQMAIVSVSNSDDLIEGFYKPFEASAHYLGMKYLGNLHAWVASETIPKAVKHDINLFLKQLNNHV